MAYRDAGGFFALPCQSAERLDDQGVTLNRPTHLTSWLRHLRTFRRRADSSSPRLVACGSADITKISERHKSIVEVRLLAKRRTASSLCMRRYPQVRL